MKKPTVQEIIDFAKTRVMPNEIIDIICDEDRGASFAMKSGRAAHQLESSLNNKFDVWAYAMVHPATPWMKTSVSISLRGEELSKCPKCGWLDGMHSQYCSEKKNA